MALYIKVDKNFHLTMIKILVEGLDLGEQLELERKRSLRDSEELNYAINPTFM